MKIYSLILVLFICSFSLAQQYKANISSIEVDGIHSIKLNETLRASAKDHFNYLRLKDSKNNEVPYVLTSDKNENYATFKTLNIVSNEQLKDSITSIIISHNLEQLNELVLKIANTNTNKTATIYGSNTKTKWFGLAENISLNNLKSNSEAYVEKQIDLPLNTYTFYKININDKTSVPLQILEVGYYENVIFKTALDEVKAFKIKTTTNKENKTTVLHFTADKMYTIDAVAFTILDDYFLRTATISIIKQRHFKNKTESFKEVLDVFQLNSTKNNTFVLNQLNASNFTIEIQNQDNLALDIENIKLFQKPKYIVAALKANETYNIVIDSTLKKPQYDLNYFVNNTKQAISKATISNFEALETLEKNTSKKSFWETNLFMWICIILGGLIVVYFAVGLLKEVK